MQLNRVLICGDRNWKDQERIGKCLEELDPVSVTIIHGGCRGADLLAGIEARSRGFTIQEFPANWQKYGRAAGPIRNQQMLDEGKPDKVLVFHDTIEKSKGSADMMARALKAGIEVELCTTGSEIGCI